MAQPTVSNVQPVDPILTNLLVGYAQREDRFVAGRVFPAVPVDKDSGTYFIFSKKFFFTDEMQVRAPGADFARSGFSTETSTYATLQYALAHPIADEIRANSQIPMGLEEAAVRWLSQKSLLRKERQWAADFMKTGVWGTDNTSATDWDDFAGSDPVNDVLTARRTISNNTGYDGNTMVMGYIVHQALVNHPDIIDRVKYVQAATMATVESALAAAFGVANYWVGKASYNSANEGQTASLAAILDDDCLVCNVSGSPSLYDASAGYTFTWQPGGGVGTISRYRDDEKDADLLKLKEQWDQKAVSTDCGYFFSDIV
jgi:hypothetical protein